MEGLKALPGVSAVGGISFLPLAGVGPATSFWRADAPQPPPSERPVADARPVTPGFFEAMGIQRLAGRDIAESDTQDRDPVAVINETFARQIYPGDNPIGRRFILNLGNDKPHEIVGVVGDVKLASARRRDSSDGVSLVAPVRLRHHVLRRPHGRGSGPTGAISRRA